jgi:gas vesicle protein
MIFGGVEMSEKEENNVMAGALLLLAGGLLGAGVALLFAPQSGKKTRRDIVRYSRKAQRKAADAVDEFSASIADMVETVGEKAEDLLHSGKDLAYDAKKGLLTAIDEGKSRLEKQRARLEKIIG